MLNHLRRVVVVSSKVPWGLQNYVPIFWGENGSKEIFQAMQRSPDGLGCFFFFNIFIELLYNGVLVSAV